MTSRTIEQLMEGFRAMERGDVEAIVALAHPDVEFVNPDTALEPGTRHGLDGLRGGMAAFLEAFSDLRFEYDRIVEIEDCVVVTGTFKARGRGSGMELPDAPFAVVVTQRDGKLVRYEWFNTPEDALRAGGVAT
jgi:ketosteroid isomerase-like protein